METITEKEIKFLLFVNTSEESFLKNVTLDFQVWNCNRPIIFELLKDLIQQELLGLGKLTLKDFIDLNKEEALATITSWEYMQTSLLILFLTESGWERWNSNAYDWGISPEREKQLLFSNKGRLKS